MRTNEPIYTRRQFTRAAMASGSAMALGSAALAATGEGPPPRIKTGVIGCGSVSGS